MQQIQELIEEREWLLREFDILKHIRRILQEREKNSAALHQSSNALDKSVRRKIKSLLRKVGRTERRVYSYERKLLHKLEKMGYDRSQPITFELNGKMMGKKTLEEQVKIYSDKIVLKTSLYHGSIPKLLKERETNWEELEKEIVQAMRDISSLIALLEHLTFKHEINRGKFLARLKSYGFPEGDNTGLTEFLIEHWPETEKMKEAAGYNYFSLFKYGLPSLSPVITNKLISFESIVEGICSMARRAGAYTGNLFQGGLPLASTIYTKGFASWEDIVEDLPFLCKTIQDLPSLEKAVIQKNITWKQLVNGLQKVNAAEGKYLIPKIFAIMLYLIDKDTWPKIIKVISKEKNSEVISSFLDNFIKSKVIKSLISEYQCRLFGILLSYILSSSMKFGHRLAISAGPFSEFAGKWIAEGKSIKKITAKDFWEYMYNLERSNILGELKIRDLVAVKGRKDDLYSVVAITSKGYLLRKETGDSIGSAEGPFYCDQLAAFKGNDDWKDVADLRERGFLVIHTTNTFSGGVAALPELTYGSFLNIERDIKSQGRYTISCSSIHPEYTTGIAVDPSKGYAVGDVLYKGKIYAAYLFDAGTWATLSAHFRSTDKQKSPVRLAVTGTTPYNELLLQKWKIDGVFYTKKTPPEEVQKLKEIAWKHQLKIFAIDEKTNTWKIFAYSKDNERFIEIREKAEFKAAA